MNILDILDPAAVRVPLVAMAKKAIIDELVDAVVDAGLARDPATLKAAVWEREQQRSTGIGDGLAIPHGKANTVDRLVMAVGKPATPIDFESIDGRPVRLIFLLLSPPGRTAEHIQALSKISRLMTDAKVRMAAYNATSARELHDLLVNAERDLLAKSS